MCPSLHFCCKAKKDDRARQLVLSNILGGFIAKIDLRYTLYASIPFFALMISLVFSMQEPKRHKLISEQEYIKELLKIIKVL